MKDTPNTAVQPRIYIDFLAIVSAFAVVMLHANGVFWSHPAGRLWITSMSVAPEIMKKIGTAK